MIDYDSSTALIVVDVQNDFADAKGSLYVNGGEEVVPVVNHQIERARRAGSPVVYTQDWHPESTPHFARDGGIWPVHCVAGSWGASFHPQLSVVGPSIQKGIGAEDGYSGFSVRDSETGEVHGTGLSDLLEQHQVGRVVVVGLALDYCVKASALDAVAYGLKTVVILAGTRAVELESGDGERAIEELEAAGVKVV